MNLIMINKKRTYNDLKRPHEEDRDNNKLKYTKKFKYYNK